jgi:hypothetical protein
VALSQAATEATGGKKKLPRNQDKIRPNTTTFHLFTEQHVSTDLGHLQVHNSYFLKHLAVL